MDYKSKFNNLLSRFFPKRGEGVLRHYQKLDLDKLPEMPYTVDTEAGKAVTEHKFVGKITMLEAKPAITVETIVGAVENKYPKAVVELATILRDMKLQYSLHASALSSKLFDAQDTLGLTSEEVRTVIGHIIDQKDVIIDTTQSAIDIIYKPK